MPAPTAKEKNVKKKTVFFNKKLLRTLLIVSPLLLISMLYGAFYLYYQDKIYPGVEVAGVNVGSLRKAEAKKVLEENTTTPDQIEIGAKDKIFDLSLNGLGFSYNIERTLDDAFAVNRSASGTQKYLDQILSFKTEKNISLKINLNLEELEKYLQVISAEIATEPVLPFVKLEGKNIVVERGSPGEYADIEDFKTNLIRNLSNRDFEAINLKFVNDDSSLSDEEAKVLYERAIKLNSKSIVLENEFDVFSLKEKELFSFLDGNGNYYSNNIDDYIKTLVEPRVNREPQNATFNFESGKVLEFKPARDGLTVNTIALKDELVKELEALESEDKKVANIKIPVESKSPEITTDKVNDLGIKELLGRGTSKFVGSIPSRMHNVSHASSKFNGVLVPPNFEFSFNGALGDVSTLTGYKQAYVIRDGRTVLGDGGGVCQVSSTLFRALLNAGLPITERRAHSYRVGYYEQDVGPGLDATVFAPTTDLKFKNDTPGHLLIQTYYDGKNATLAFEIYGTSDGRKVTTTKPVMLSQTNPPDDVYIDDPTLPTGQVKQVEHKAWGAKVSFDHKVERNGEVIFQKTFLSAYRPWGAIFMRGTGPVQ